MPKAKDLSRIRVVSRRWAFKDEVQANMRDAEKELSDLAEQGYEIVAMDTNPGMATWTLRYRDWS